MATGQREFFIRSHLESQIHFLEDLLKKLPDLYHLQDRVQALSNEKEVEEYLLKHPHLKSILDQSSLEDIAAIYSLMAIDQASIVLNKQMVAEENRSSLHRAVEVLKEVDRFYSEIGGVIGYHLTVLKLIMEHEKDAASKDTNIVYSKPKGINLSKNDRETKEAIFAGIKSIPEMAEMYPVGGAGDRLDLHDEATGTLLPAAVLPFEGRSLLEGLVRDVQAREYLYYKLYHKQVITPIAMMTSQEKANQTHIIHLFESKQYFHRPQSSFFFFLQPLVPVITKQGYWSMATPLKPTLKPGGHGVIWKVAQEEGVFEWLKEQKRKYAIVRQINNPVAGEDFTLLALAGYGYKERKAFGFISCERLLNSAEGMNVLKEQKTSDGYDYCISNVEYTDIHLKGLKEEPVEEGSPYSQYPCNTNTLFADLNAITECLKEDTLPGQLINMKHKVPYIDVEGKQSHIEGGRLESMMQNIADSLIDHFPCKASPTELSSLKTFIAYHLRSRVISTTKKLYQREGSSIATPEHALYDHLSNHRALLEELCGFVVPAMPSMEEYLKTGPSFIFLFHPAIGPLYHIISQKIRKGVLEWGAELQLEIAEVCIENLKVAGSLIIRASDMMGSLDDQSVLNYGEETGKCVLRRVVVNNKGIDRSSQTPYWKNEMPRHESLQIILHGNGEFCAENVTFLGDILIEVPNGYRLTAYQEEGEEELLFKKEPINGHSWAWKYRFDDQGQVIINR